VPLSGSEIAFFANLALKSSIVDFLRSLRCRGSSIESLLHSPSDTWTVDREMELLFEPWTADRTSVGYIDGCSSPDTMKELRSDVPGIKALDSWMGLSAAPIPSNFDAFRGKNGGLSTNSVSMSAGRWWLNLETLCLTDDSNGSDNLSMLRNSFERRGMEPELL
jgi:hypothetical protein